MARKICDTCENCGGTGTCQPCRGSGRSGFFLTLSPDLKLCRWCKGSANCRRCGGTGMMVTFQPYVYVEHSLTVPLSITCAAFTGALWRFIAIPDEVLDLSEGEQMAWVSATVRKHFLDEKGKCLLFGDITGYTFVQTPDVSVSFDTEGRHLETKNEPFEVGTLSLGVGNKMIEVRRDGTVKIEAAKREER